MTKESIEALLMVVQGLCALAMVLAGFVMKRLWKELDELRDSEMQTRAQLTAVNLQLAREYPTKEDMERLEKRIEEGFKKVSLDTDRIFDRLERKVDKHGHVSGGLV